MKTYTFMNKSVELFDIEMDAGLVYKIKNRRDESKHLYPFHMLEKRNQVVGVRSFNSWWQNRRIPNSRGGIKTTLEVLGISLDELAEKALGLSLSDQYWIRPSIDVKWEDVNFFTNDFSDDVGELLFEGKWKDGSLESPNNTSDGVVKKKWKIIGGTRCLIKGSSSLLVLQPQPFREKFASELLGKMLGGRTPKFQEYVKYDILWDDDRVYSVCPNFVTPDTEYVSMNQINEAMLWKKSNSQSEFNWCEALFGENRRLLHLLLAIDYILLNEDRHYGNFGFIRDTNTGELLCPAPIFDTGNCLFYDSNKLSEHAVNSKPFSREFSKQMKLIDPSLIAEELNLAKNHMEELFWHSFTNCFETEERLTTILGMAKARCERLL